MNDVQTAFQLLAVRARAQFLVALRDACIEATPASRLAFSFIGDAIQHTDIRAMMALAVSARAARMEAA